MSGHDDKQLNEEIASLRAQYSSLSHEAPDESVDAGIRAAAGREVRRHYTTRWAAATGIAACIALAVILVPTLLIETSRQSVQTSNADLVLIAERRADEAEVRQKQRESMAMRVAPAAAPPMPQAAVEGKGEVSLAHEEWLAREEVAPAQPAAESQGTLADTTKAMSPRAHAQTIAPATIDVVRAELANADEAAWRKKLLALREQGNGGVAEQLLADYRGRFDKPETFTLDDLERMNNEY